MKIASNLFCAGCAAMLFAALPLAAAVNDSDAGTWKMIVLTSPTQIAVPAPVPVTDPGYLSEVAAVKSAQANLTSAQRTEITYWGAGGVYRWNQILLGLVAASDLPPEPNSDGTYSFLPPLRHSRFRSIRSRTLRTRHVPTVMLRSRSSKR